jgi:hypothetical protein
MSRCVALLGPRCSGTPDTKRQAVAHKLHIPLNRTYPRKVDKLPIARRWEFLGTPIAGFGVCGFVDNPYGSFIASLEHCLLSS